jgi:hypothetical protein
MATDFNLYGRFLDGENIQPVLSQRAELGFNFVRVFTLYTVPLIGDCQLSQHPNFYAMLPAFCRLLASYGLYIELVAYTGPYPEGYQQNHWFNLCQAVQLEKNVFLQYGNEINNPVNQVPDWNPQPFPGFQCNKSSGGESGTYEPMWDYATMHFNGAFEWQRKNGHGAMEVWGGPSITDESTRCPDVDNSVDHYYDASAASALLCAGSCYHSVNGKTSTLWQPGGELECATAHGKGAKSVDLRCQEGDYRNHPPGDFLRIYSRFVNDSEEYFVYIRY